MYYCGYLLGIFGRKIIGRIFVYLLVYHRVLSISLRVCMCLLTHVIDLTIMYWPAAGLERCGKSCRLRWINYLRPELKRG
ncbi:putative Homeobox domain-containing protein [Rosa chinensis]|uniref:Putative Homeobox domain-containing protein n=1 Tax=Rosa chinensis TaxID=74649 RepID=A0A2P6RXY8_ROSCH|nr:putative Homeobox domain-containing protein [Rosa chinensis]